MHQYRSNNSYAVLLLALIWSCGMVRTIAQHRKIDSLKSVIRSAPNDTTKALLYAHLWSEYQKTRPDSAGFVADKGIALSQRLNYTKGLAYNYHNKGLSFTHSVQLDSALYFYKKSLSLNEKLRDSSLLGLLQLNMGNIYFRKDLPEKAIAYFKTFLAISEALDNRTHMAFANNSIGMAYFDSEQYDTAITHFLIAKKLFTEQHNPLGISKVHSNLALLYMNANDQYDKAIAEFKRALAINKKNHFKKQAALNLNNIGTCHIKQKKYQKAIEVIKKSEIIYRDIDNTTGLAYNAIGYGNAFKGLERYTNAIDQFDFALRSLPKTNQEERVKALMGLGACYEGLKHPSQAKAMYAKALKAAYPKSLVEYRIVILEKLAAYHANKDEFDAAYGYTNTLLHLKDSVNKLRNLKRLQQLQIKYEVAEIERNNSNLALAMALKDKDIARKRMQIALAAGLLVCSLLATLVWYTRFKSKKRVIKVLAAKNATIHKNNKTLEQQGAVLQKALTEKELLLREVHHRVKNNMQLISSFLNIQERTKADLDIKTFVENGQLMIKSMVLVQDTLYASKRLDKIPLQSYLENLTRGIALSFKNGTHKIDFQINADGIFLGINKTISIGLIVNELVYNALKHAFKGRENGKITLSMCRTELDSYSLTVSDNGTGFVSESPFKTGLGLELVSLMANQLRGVSTIKGTKNGTQANITFKMK